MSYLYIPDKIDRENRSEAMEAIIAHLESLMDFMPNPDRTTRILSLLRRLEFYDAGYEIESEASVKKLRDEVKKLTDKLTKAIS